MKRIALFLAVVMGNTTALGRHSLQDVILNAVPNKIYECKPGITIAPLEEFRRGETNSGPIKRFIVNLFVRYYELSPNLDGNIMYAAGDDWIGYGIFK